MNGNNVIDSADYNLWRSTFGSTTDRRADGNRNGIVDAADDVVWKNQQSTAGAGASAAAISTVVPEPGLAGLLLGGFMNCQYSTRIAGRGEQPFNTKFLRHFAFLNVWATGDNYID